MGDFQALVLDERNGKCTASVRRVRENDLPLGDVTVSVKYSSLNYKDGMVITGTGGLVRRFPHIPGGDMAAIVEFLDVTPLQARRPGCARQLSRRRALLGRPCAKGALTG